MLIMIAALCACGERTTTIASRPDNSGERSETSTEGLNDVQIECRSSEMLDIGQADTVFGSTCDKPTLSLALDLFDRGSGDGFTEALIWDDAQLWLCVCATSSCSEETNLEVMAKSRRVMIETEGKRERDGVLRVTNSLESHSCLSAVAGSEIYKMGFRCAFATGLKSQLLEQERFKIFMRLEKGDEFRARERVRTCASK